MTRSAEDPDLQGYRDGLAQGVLRGQWCPVCEQFSWPPRPRCSRCGASASEWRTVASTGALHTWTVVWRSTLAEFAERVPYVVGIVSLPEGIRLVGLVDVDPADLEPGMQLDWTVSTEGDEPRVTWSRPRVAS